MTWNGAFPSSPLSRSALRGDTSLAPALSSTLGGETSSEDEAAFLPGSSRKAAASLRPRPVAPAGLSRALDQHRHDGSEEGRQEAHAARPPSSNLYDARRAPSSLSRLAASPGRAATAPPKWASSSPSSLRPPSSPVARTSAYEGRTTTSPPSPRYFSTPASRRRSSGIHNGLASPAPLFGSLIGSFEESLLSGRMSTFPSKPLQFDAELGVLGMGKCKPSLKCPPHLNLKFPAYFYNLDAMAQLEGKASPGSPYVGTIDLEGHYLDGLLAHDLQGLGLQAPTDDAGAQPASSSSQHAGAKSVPLMPAPTMRKGATSRPSASEGPPSFPGYRIPPKGQIQVVIKNPNLTAVKLFLVPYDLSDMPPGTKTFIRQKSMAVPVRGAGAAATAVPASAPTSPQLADPSPPASLPTRAASGSQPSAAPRDKLRYAIHLQFCSAPAPPAKAARGSGAGAGFSGRRDLPRHELGDEAEEQEPFEIELPGDETAPRRSSRPAPPHLERAAHRQAPKIYLHKTIRVVFAPRVPDRSEKLTIVTDTPGGTAGNAKRELMYAPYAGPGDEWKEAKRRIKERQRRERFDEAEQQRGRPLATSPIAFASPPEAALDVNSDPNGEHWRPPVAGDALDVELDKDLSGLVPASSGSSWGASSQDFGQGADEGLQRWSDGTSSAVPVSIVMPTGGQTAQSVPSSLPTSSSTLAMAKMGSSSSSGGPAIVTPSSEDDGKALLDAWHQTLRRGSAFASLGRPMSPASRQGRPTSPHEAMHRPASATSNGSRSGTPTQMTSLATLGKGATSPPASQHRHRGSSVSSHHSTGPQPMPKLSAAALSTEAVNGLMASPSLEDLLSSTGAPTNVAMPTSSSAGSTSAVAPSLIRQLSSQRQATISAAPSSSSSGRSAKQSSARSGESVE